MLETLKDFYLWRMGIEIGLSAIFLVVILIVWWWRE